MSEERVRRVGVNEALYRQVNERIEDVNDAFGVVTGDLAVFCECGDLECTDQIVLDRAAYERVRSSPVHFVVRPGHDDPEAEHPVERYEAYWVIEKDAGTPADVAREANEQLEGREDAE